MDEWMDNIYMLHLYYISIYFVIYIQQTFSFLKGCGQLPGDFAFIYTETKSLHMIHRPGL